MKRWSVFPGVMVCAIGIAPMNPGHAAGVTAPDSLSGAYLLYYEQTSKSCGPTFRPLEFEIWIDVADDSIRITSLWGFYGFRIIEASLDRRTGRFAHHVERRADLGSTQATFALDLNGRIDPRSSGPELRFDLVFDKLADDPAWNCRVTGKGRASRIS